jgi:hypothetical protein
MGFGLEIGFIEHLYTQPVKTSIFSAIADTLQFIATHTQFSSFFSVVTNFLVTASNNGRSPSSGFS